MLQAMEHDRILSRAHPSTQRRNNVRMMWTAELATRLAEHARQGRYALIQCVALPTTANSYWNNNDAI